MTSAFSRDDVAKHIEELQLKIIETIQAYDKEGPQFAEVSLPHREGTTGKAFVLERTESPRPGSAPFAPVERAALVYSLVDDRQMPQNVITDLYKSNTGIGVPPSGASFSVVHLSLMIHPRSPHAPSTHANWRYFELYDSEKKLVDWWFGGSTDLMPALLYEEDCTHFHHTIQSRLNKHGAHVYEALKPWCDQYFYNPFNKQAIGAGGIFFDRLSPNPNPKFDIHDELTQRPKSPEDCFAFFKDTSEAWLDAYSSIFAKRAFEPWTEEERLAQLIFRGYIIDFFHVVAMGFRFGLVTDAGSLEAMRLVLPEKAQWAHSEVHKVLPHRAKGLVEVLKHPKEWA